MMGSRRVGSAGFLAGIAILCVVFLAPPNAGAGGEDAGTYGAAFLRVPIGAAGMSVPNVVASMDPDASLVFSNPASLGDLRSPQLFLSRAGWLEDLTMNAASFGAPIDRLGLVWSLGSRLLQSGDIQGFDADENIIESESYYGLSFTSTVSRRFAGSGVALGAGVTYTREHLPGETGAGVTFSLGASYARSGHRFDVYAENLGGSINFSGYEYPIESRYVAGYGYSIVGGPGRFDVGLQAVVSNSELREIEFGGAYRFNRFMTLRAGYNHAMDAATENAMPLSAGLGFRSGSFFLDYAYTSQEYFSATHTFSMGFLFGARGTGGRASHEVSAAEVPSPAIAEKDRAAAPAPESPLAPPATASPQESPGVTAKPKPPAASATYVVLSGVHSRLESAQAEVRALRLLKVDSTIEESEGQYRVVIGKFGTRKQAETALVNYQNRGHSFRLLTQHD